MIPITNRLIVLIQIYIVQIHVHQSKIIVQFHIKNKIKIYQSSKNNINTYLKIGDKTII